MSKARSNDVKMAMGSRPDMEELLRHAETLHAQYIRTMRQIYESLHPQRVGDGSSGNDPESPGIGGQSPALIPRFTLPPGCDAGGPMQPVSPRPRRYTNDNVDAGRLSGFVASKHVPASLYDYESSDDDHSTSGAASNFIALLPLGPRDRSRDPKLRYLPSEEFTVEQLVQYLKSTEFSEGSQIALHTLYHTRDSLEVDNIFDEREDEAFYCPTYEVYDVVGREGAVQPRHRILDPQRDQLLQMSEVWDTIKAVNTVGDQKAMGRITIFQEPSPRMLGALHMTMQKHFDMDELLDLVTTTRRNKGKTKAYMLNRAHELDERRQRSFVFVFKYYTVVAEDVDPAPWQAFDRRPADRRSPDHIDITECSSVLALSLSGDAWRETRARRRRTRPGQQQHAEKQQDGKLFHTFAPWHLLLLQFFPDNEHEIRSIDDYASRQRFVNGPHAFLEALAAEYRDAVRRNVQLNELITRLVTPPSQFMFDARLRDKLLFEDKHFTYSRRYFWAYNTLGVINDGLRAMIQVYTDTFCGGVGITVPVGTSAPAAPHACQHHTAAQPSSSSSSSNTSDFWAGRHATLWPHPSPDSLDGIAYATQHLPALRRELEAAVRDLARVADKNEATRREIRSLREQLFSGSSVRESRRAIDQGDNINALTSLSMVFLPLSFVTGVFGITTFDIPTNDWRFPVTMVMVSAPFILLIFLFRYLKHVRRGAAKLIDLARRQRDGLGHHLAHHAHSVSHVAGLLNLNSTLQQQNGLKPSSATGPSPPGVLLGQGNGRNGDKFPASFNIDASMTGLSTGPAHYASSAGGGGDGTGHRQGRRRFRPRARRRTSTTNKSKDARLEDGHRNNAGRWWRPSLPLWARPAVLTALTGSSAAVHASATCGEKRRASIAEQIV